MSTMSLIGIVNPNGSICAVYCHNDGYPQYQLSTLRTYHNNEEAAWDIVKLGDLSVLKAKLNPTTKTHSFSNPEHDVTVAYCRDRSDDFHDYYFNCIEEMEKDIDCDIDFVYLWDENKWKCYQNLGANLWFMN